jgi:hypothetical protein
VSASKEIQNVAIVGTGVIGASWAAWYLSRGFDVIATDPAPSAEVSLRKYIDEAWKTLIKTGLSPNASRDRLTFEPRMTHALAKADFVQENAPERPEFKIKLFAEMDDATPPDSILASSSSGLTMDVIQSATKRPERCVIGHPFNPPHIVPLVEVVGGARTSEDTVLQWHLGGGQNGIHHFMEHLMDGLAGLMRSLGSPEVTPELKQTVTDGVIRMAGKRSVEELAAEENEVLTGIFSERARVGL